MLGSTSCVYFLCDVCQGCYESIIIHEGSCKLMAVFLSNIFRAHLTVPILLLINFRVSSHKLSCENVLIYLNWSDIKSKYIYLDSFWHAPHTLQVLHGLFLGVELYNTLTQFIDPSCPFIPAFLNEMLGGISLSWLGFIHNDHNVVLSAVTL